MKNCPLWRSDQTLKPPTLQLKIWKIFRARSCKGSRGNPAQPPDCLVPLVQQRMNQLSPSIRLCHSFCALLQGTMKGFTLLCVWSRRKLAFIVTCWDNPTPNTKYWIPLWRLNSKCFWPHGHSASLHLHTSQCGSPWKLLRGTGDVPSWW